MTAETVVSRTRALIVLAITLGIAVTAWILLQRAADAGIARLERMDRMFAFCDSMYARASNRDDSARVFTTALADTIDPKSDNAIARCGDFGNADALRQRLEQRNPREMTGQPMPSGLR